jgi:hypothetical protein
VSAPLASLFQYSERVAGSRARSVPGSALYRALALTVVDQRIAFEGPFAETLIWAPGNSYVAEEVVGVVLNVPELKPKR